MIAQRNLSLLANRLFKEHGGRRIPETRFAAKEARLRPLWTTRLGHQMEALPEFDDVFRAVRREVRRGIFPE